MVSHHPRRQINYLFNCSLKYKPFVLLVKNTLYFTGFTKLYLFNKLGKIYTSES